MPNARWRPVVLGTTLNRAHNGGSYSGVTKLGRVRIDFDPTRYWSEVWRLIWHPKWSHGFGVPLAHGETAARCAEVASSRFANLIKSVRKMDDEPGETT